MYEMKHSDKMDTLNPTTQIKNQNITNIIKSTLSFLLKIPSAECLILSKHMHRFG